MSYITPFSIAWTLAALYGVVLLATAVRITIRLARGRLEERDPEHQTGP